jgi:hypothetical protein
LEASPSCISGLRTSREGGDAINEKTISEEESNDEILQEVERR